ncbi:MAG TPA: hypothetical protein VIW78_08240 [Burkholderiales bacterium]
MKYKYRSGGRSKRIFPSTCSPYVSRTYQEGTMQTKLTDRPAEQVIAAIHALDLESVKIRAMDPKLGEGWTREYAEGIEQGYRTYLTMLAKYPDHAEDILLSKDVDEFWHTHILQTMKYTDDCEAVFGKYLHHQPHVGEVTAADVEKRTALAEKTRRLYQREFGNEQDYNAAWAGIPVRAEIRAGNAAMSAASIRAGNAAMSAASIRVGNAAMSAAAIRADNAAMSAAAIRAGNAAMSAAAIRADNAAMSAAAIRVGNAATSSETLLVA